MESSNTHPDSRPPMNSGQEFIEMFEKLNKHISMVYYTLLFSLFLVLFFALILWLFKLLPWQESEYLNIVSAYGLHHQVFIVFTSLSVLQTVIGLIFYLYLRRSPRLAANRERMDMTTLMTKALKRLVTFSIIAWLLFLQIGLYGLLYFMTFNSIKMLLIYAVVSAALLLVCRPNGKGNLRMIAEITQFSFLQKALDSTK